MTPHPQTGDLGIVAIGRNEGQRLINCLTSLQSQNANIIYVDSGSTDGSAHRLLKTSRYSAGGLSV
jgi:glycosyltransferase involved in cell wall biosynthesis